MTSPNIKVEQLFTASMMQMYRKDFYGMSSCKLSYDPKFLRDLKELLEITTCMENNGNCFCNCTSQLVEEKINIL